MRILLVGLYSSIEACVREQVDAKVGCSLYWESVETAPQALLAVHGENGDDFDVVVLDNRAYGIAPSVNGLARDLSASLPRPHLVAVGHMREDCQQLLAAGCDRWCQPAELAHLLIGMARSRGLIVS